MKFAKSVLGLSVAAATAAGYLLGSTTVGEIQAAPTVRAQRQVTDLGECKSLEAAWLDIRAQEFLLMMPGPVGQPFCFEIQTMEAPK